MSTEFVGDDDDVNEELVDATECATVVVIVVGTNMAVFGIVVTNFSIVQCVIVDSSLDRSM